jgi:DNA-directed RNA polymerase subunit RPC12/RpoP
VSTANCPTCGGPIEFAIGSSAVVVCRYCSSVVARTDRGIESHGVVAALVDTGSPLAVGTTGRFRGTGFRITGRSQMRHPMGGTWDEWYAALDDGRWGWLAEAQGRFYFTFKVGADAPSRDALQLGATVTAIDSLTVAEIAEASLISAEGELPWVPEPGSSYAYADLTGTDRRFATIDYSEEPPVVFKGAETSLAELGISGEAARKPRVATTALNCTKCGGALELRAPDEAERVWCPYCGAGHDVTEGKLRFFQMQKKRKVAPVIPLGATGTIEGDPYVVAGFMQRSVHFDITYYWTEYLIYNASKGFRWLVHSDDHWSFVTPLRPGEVEDGPANVVAQTVRYAGRRYRVFQSAAARVTYVVGEFYWKVAAGEEADTADYIAPPFGISKEVTRGASKEVAYSHARYMDPAEVEKAFASLPRLPRPRGIGPMQPFAGARLAMTWMVMVALLVSAAIAIGIRLPNRVVLQQTYDMAAAPAVEGAPPNARIIFTEPFTLAGQYNVEVEADANVNNSWMYVVADLVNDASGARQTFELPFEFYSGVEGGESWKEGTRNRTVHLSRPDAGAHVLRFETQWEQGRVPPLLRVTVREGVFRWLYFLLALVAISILPAYSVLRRFAFEGARWKESSYSPYGQAIGDDDDEE